MNCKQLSQCNHDRVVMMMPVTVTTSKEGCGIIVAAQSVKFCRSKDTQHVMWFVCP